MLAALFLAGLVSAVAAPMLIMETDDDETERDVDDDLEKDSGGLLLEPSGITHSIDLGSGETVLDNFEPGKDSVVMDVGSADAEIVIPDDENGPVSVGASLGDASSMVVFPMLDALPSDDVILTFEDEDATVEVTLADVLSSFEDDQEEDEQDEDTMSPLSPVEDIGDTGVGEDLGIDPLRHVDEDDSGIGIDIGVPALGPGTGDVIDIADDVLQTVTEFVPGVPLAPATGDDVDVAVDTVAQLPGTVLSPISEDLDGVGEITDDPSEVVSDIGDFIEVTSAPFDAGDPPVVIPEFDVEAGDLVRVTLDQEDDGSPLKVDVQPINDAKDAEVKVNDEQVAILKGAVNASVANVVLEFDPAAFPVRI
jgi:hypothetical protein